MPADRYFFDSSAFLAIIKREEKRSAVLALIGQLKAPQRVTSVLVAYELYRGVVTSSAKRKMQFQDLDEMLSSFTVKPVHAAQAMAGAKIFRDSHSKGAIDPILAAQCVDGGFIMVTVNRQDFERVPDLKLAAL